MMIKLVRIGKDAEVKQVGGKSVLNVSVAYDVGWGDNKKTQWMRLALWGDRADKAAQYMTKGKQLVVRVDDIHVREFDGKDGKAFSLEGTLVGFDYVSDGSRSGDSAPRQAPAQDTHNAAKSNGYQDVADDDIPF